MSQLVVMNLGLGNFGIGFPVVTAQLWNAEAAVTMQFTGSLPAAAEIDRLYTQWQTLNAALLNRFRIRNLNAPNLSMIEFEIDEDEVTQVSRSDLDHCAIELRQRFNQWLSTTEFQPIDRTLRTQLRPTDEIRIVLTASRESVLKFPWVLWDFLDDFPDAELALSPPNYQPVRTATIAPQAQPKSQVKVLAILGDSTGIDIRRDRQVLEALPNATVEFLVEPTRSQINAQLWEAGWDVLFFAGHSSSGMTAATQRGELQINPTTALSVEQLKYGLRRAIAQGLKLAIFNSCDGLGLAWDLADLQIPQMIVMREPVPDRVAQRFVTELLSAFSQGRSLYLAVREAREKLQDLEDEFPGATWLPVICQNPAERPQTWQEWYQVPPERLPLLNRWRDWKPTLVGSALATGLVMGVRALGLLQSIELAAFDQFMQWQPRSTLDSRLLIITVTEEDIKDQKNEPRKGSLSDRNLNLILKKLDQFKPAAIGLDIYRDFDVEPNRSELAKFFRSSDRFFAICKRPDPVDDPTGILPPPEVPGDRLGFSDFVEDRDGVLRRQLLRMSANPISPCNPSESFAVKLAFHYLQSQGVKAGFTQGGDLQLGDRIYPKLGARSSGYQNLDAAGSQILLNYRGLPRQIAQQITVRQLLNEPINPKAIENRIILIGVVSNSSSDYWATAYGRSFGDRVPGVLLQAQMISQLISAGLKQRSLLLPWPVWLEILWIFGGAIGSGSLVIYLHQTKKSKLVKIVSGLIWIVTISGICFILMMNGVWVPWIPMLCVSGLSLWRFTPLDRSMSEISRSIHSGRST